jgi:hypothetical protein
MFFNNDLLNHFLNTQNGTQNYPLSESLNISPKTPLAVTADPAPAPCITIGLSP